jgi:hypothetical protein
VRLLKAFTMDVVVVALVVVDAVLIGVAVHHGAGSSIGAAVSYQVSSPQSGSPAAQAAPIAHDATLLSFESASTGWRATGGCARRAHLTSTTDDGRTWQPVSLPAPHVLRIDLTAPGSGWIVGATAGCLPEFFSTADGGKTWAPSAGLGQAWVVLGNRLRRPAGTMAAPCGKGAPVDAIAPASVSIALVTCGSGLLDTSDGGATWAPVAAFPGAGQAVTAALVPGSSGRGVALLRGVAGCDGLAVARTDDAGGLWRTGPCLSALRYPATVSLAADGSGYATGSGKSVTTKDAGASWT